MRNEREEKHALVLLSTVIIIIGGRKKKKRKQHGRLASFVFCCCCCCCWFFSPEKRKKKAAIFSWWWWIDRRFLVGISFRFQRTGPLLNFSPTQSIPAFMRGGLVFICIEPLAIAALIITTNVVCVCMDRVVILNPPAGHLFFRTALFIFRFYLFIYFSQFLFIYLFFSPLTWTHRKWIAASWSSSASNNCSCSPIRRSWTSSTVRDTNSIPVFLFSAIGIWFLLCSLLTPVGLRLFDLK